jgi:predicted nucleic acid-binding protein
MRQFTVIYDSCVLYPSRLRSLLMHLALSDLYRARWTESIHEEWMRSVCNDYPDITRRDVERTRDLMNAHALDALITGYERLIDSLVLPDPDDRHVLAAAIVGRADAIVTFNLKDFPEDQLRTYDIEAIHPDTFLVCQFDLSSAAVCAAVRTHRISLKRPPRDAEDYLDELEQDGLPQIVELLRQCSERI